MSDEKTEEPTSKKLKDARKKGQHAKSQDAAAAVLILGMTVCLYAAADSSMSRLYRLVLQALEAVGGISSTTDLLPLLAATLAEGILTAAPFVVASLLLGIAGHAMQVGLNVSFDPIAPKFENLSPASGFKKMFSMKSIIEAVKSLIKAVAMASIVYVVIYDLLTTFAGSAYLPTASIAIVGWSSLLKLLTAAVILFIIVAPVDFGLQVLLFRKDQRMSKDEVKREYKETEGDPLIKSKRQQLAQELAASAPRQTVPGATVVVTNPTHYAVALYYETGRTVLPVVVSKGADTEAAEIRKIAEEHGIPLVSDPPLARALFQLRVNEPIPRPLFEAVAAILRWVQSVKTTN